VIDVGGLAGQSGEVVWIERDPTCGCWQVIVRGDGFEWIGKPSEVRR